MNEWISIKHRLPVNGEIVIVKFKYSEPFVCVARFLENFISFDSEYKHIFIMIVHPRFPKQWLFSDEYRKISRIPKNKVEFWMPLPTPPKENHE